MFTRIILTRQTGHVVCVASSCASQCLYTTGCWLYHSEMSARQRTSSTTWHVLAHQWACRLGSHMYARYLMMPHRTMSRSFEKNWRGIHSWCAQSCLGTKKIDMMRSKRCVVSSSQVSSFFTLPMFLHIVPCSLLCDKPYWLMWVQAIVVRRDRWCLLAALCIIPSNARHQILLRLRIITKAFGVIESLNSNISNFRNFGNFLQLTISIL